MFCDDWNDSEYALIAETLSVQPSDEHAESAPRYTAPTGAYRVKLGRDTVWLPPVEYQILHLLATRPYRPFSRAQIAQAISSDAQPINERALLRYIRSLREKLGFFRDYIQAVPYMGYRFKP